MNSKNTDITLDMMRESLYSAAVADAIDQVGLRRQSPRVQLRPMTGIHKLVGRCKTTLWIDFDYDDPDSYELEIQTVDTCRADDVVICAAQGSMRAAIRGELLSLAARSWTERHGTSHRWSPWHSQYSHAADASTMPCTDRKLSSTTFP